MKRLLCLCLCAGLVFGASGCGNATEPAKQTAQQTQEEKTETSEQPDEQEQIKIEDTDENEPQKMDEQQIQEIKDRQNNALKEYYELFCTGEDAPDWAEYITDVSVQLAATGIQTLVIEAEKGTEKSTAQSMATVLIGFDENNEVYAVDVVSPDGQSIYYFENPSYQKQ